MNTPAAPPVTLANLAAIDVGGPTELRAFGASLLAGLGSGQRSMLPLAMQTWRTPSRGVLARILVSVLALGELVADKLPTTPDRRTPLALAGRIVTGALAGYQIAPRGRARFARAALGAAAAVAATFAGARLRRALDRRLPGAFGALAEDAFTLGLAWAAANLARPRLAP